MKFSFLKCFLLIGILSLTSCSNDNGVLISGEYFTYDNVTYSKTIGQLKNEESYNYNISTKKLDNPLRNDFAYGVDISSIETVLNHGGVFYNQDGNEQDVFEILKESGVNFIRIRQWNDPYDENHNSYGAGINDLATNLKIMKKAQRVGLNILLDFHYSDFWADPGHQTAPKAFQNSKDILKDVYDFTFTSLEFYKNESIDIDAVQLGNEINNGLIYPYGKIDWKNYDESLIKISKILNSANKAAKDIYPNIKSIVHLANPDEDEAFLKYLDALKTNETDYDIIGISSYAFWNSGKNDIFPTLKKAVEIYNKPIMIVETSYAYTLETTPNAIQIFDEKVAKDTKYEVSIEGQIKVLNDQINMLSNLPNDMGLGIFYWEPCWLPLKGVNAGNSYGWSYQKGKDAPENYEEWKNGWANLGLFSYSGKMLPSLLTYKDIQENN